MLSHCRLKGITNCLPTPCQCVACGLLVIFAPLAARTETSREIEDRRCAGQKC